MCASYLKQEGNDHEEEKDMRMMRACRERERWTMEVIAMMNERWKERGVREVAGIGR